MRAAFIAAAAVALALPACDSGRRSPGPEVLEEIDVAPVESVVVDDDGFTPSAVTIEAGRAFEVSNEGDGPHTLTIDDPFVDTGALEPGEATTIVLESIGIHEARDRSNDDAELTITVTPSERDED